jgi:hypothetical protein
VVRSFSLLAEDEEVTTYIANIKFSRDGSRLAVARDTGDVSVWRLPAIEAALAAVRLAP